MKVKLPNLRSETRSLQLGPRRFTVAVNFTIPRRPPAKLLKRLRAAEMKLAYDLRADDPRAFERTVCAIEALVRRIRK